MRFTGIALTALSLMVFFAAFTGASAQDNPAPGSPAVGGVITSGQWGLLWQSAATYKVMRDTRPPAEKIAAVQLYAARNEYEPFQLVLNPTKALISVKVAPRTLTGPKGAKIDAWNISVRNVEYVRVTEPSSAGATAGAYPDPLPEFAPFAAPKGMNSPIWITAYVPPKTPPGDYQGVIEITADGLGKLSVPLKIKVWDFELPTVSRLRTAFGCDYDGPVRYHGAATLEQKRKLVEIYNREFWRHRVAPLKPYEFHDIKASLQGGVVKLDFSDFDTAIQKYFALFNSFNLPRFGMDDDLGLGMGEKYDQLKIEYMRTVAEHVADKGQIGKAYNYIWDEPTPEQHGSVRDAAELCRMADARIKVLLTEKVTPALGDAIDIWVPKLSHYEEEPSKKRQAAGEEVWWYVCCDPHSPYPNNFIDYPAIDQRIQPWLTWRYGVNGMLYWQTTYWRDNPYETAMSVSADNSVKYGNGDGRLLYPPVKKPSQSFIDKAPVPSIRWEMIREGIEDYDYFRILHDRAKKAGASSPAAAKAKEALDLVNECAASRTEYTRDPAKLESVRRKVAAAIEALK